MSGPAAERDGKLHMEGLLARSLPLSLSLSEESSCLTPTPVALGRVAVRRGREVSIHTPYVVPFRSHAHIPRSDCTLSQMKGLCQHRCAGVRHSIKRAMLSLCGRRVWSGFKSKSRSH